MTCEQWFAGRVARVTVATCALVALMNTASHAQAVLVAGDDVSKPATWRWPVVAQDPALQQSIINGNYTLEELKNIRTELDILSGVTTRRQDEARGPGSRPPGAPGAEPAPGAAPGRPGPGGRPGGREMPPYMSPDVVFKGRLFDNLDAVYGPGGYSNDSIPDRMNRVTDIMAKGDRVYITWMIEGHHGGELFGFPGTGKPIKIRESTMLRFKDGKIVEIESHGDELGAYLQMGGSIALPKTNKSGAK